MMKQIRKLGILALLAILAVSLVPIQVAADQPALPHAFYGDLTINSLPAAIGTTVEARGIGVRTGIQGNPIITTEAGKYGSEDPLATKLVVQGEIPDATLLEFYVNGVKAAETIQWQASWPTPISMLDLSATIATPPPGGGGGGAPKPLWPKDYQGDVFGQDVVYSIDKDGVIEDDIEVTSPDGMVTIIIPKGTTAQDKLNNPMSCLKATKVDDPPAPPAGYAMVGIAYDFGCDGNKFSPPISIIFNYGQDTLPPNASESEMYLAYYSKSEGIWLQVPSTVDTAKKTVTGKVSHFTVFAVISPLYDFETSEFAASATELKPGESVTLSLKVKNTGTGKGSYRVVANINGKDEAEKTVTLAAGGSQVVPLSVSRNEPGTYTYNVNGNIGTFTVIKPEEPTPPPTPEPARFLVSGLKIQPFSADRGEEVTITASVTNSGGSQGTYQAELRINDAVEASQTMTLDADQSKDVTFTVTRDEPGTYNVVLGNQKSQFTVDQPFPWWWIIVAVVAVAIIVILVRLLRRNRY